MPVWTKAVRACAGAMETDIEANGTRAALAQTWIEAIRVRIGAVLVDAGAIHVPSALGRVRVGRVRVRVRAIHVGVGAVCAYCALSHVRFDLTKACIAVLNGRMLPVVLAYRYYVLPHVLPYVPRIYHLALSNFTPSKEDKMPKVRLNFSKLTVTEKVARTRQVVEAMTTNSASFPNPMPALADVTAAVNALEQANADAAEARAVSKQRTAALEEKEDALDALMSRLASFVDSASGGKEEIILSAGLDVRAPSLVSNVPPGAPTNLVLTMGDVDGEIDLAWNSAQGAQSYVVQMSPNPPNDSSWTQAAVVATSKHSINNLTSGTKYWFRVAAVGVGGQSGWSDPAVKMAP